MKLEHTKLGVSVELADPIKQRHVEAFFKAKREQDGDNLIRLSSPEEYGSVVRSAWKAGVVLPPEQDPGEMSPAAVRWLGLQLDKLIGEALSIPPE
jgi:hypothetical protein